MAEEVLESLSMAEEVHAVAPEYQLWEVEARKLLSTAEVEVQIQGVALPAMPFDGRFLPPLSPRSLFAGFSSSSAMAANTKESIHQRTKASS